MEIILSKEVNRRINAATPLIVFFGLSAQQQIDILPMLEKETLFDFPDGDLLTNNALDVLTSAYESYLNSILIRLMVMLDDSRNELIENLTNLIEELLGETRITCECFYDESFEEEESLKSFKWNKIRQLSRILQQKLGIELEINTRNLTSCMNEWLHP